MDSSSSTPLAEYFWIAGIEHIEYDDENTPNNTSQGQQLDDTVDTIEEDGEAEAVDSVVDTLADPAPAASNATPGRATARHSRQNSANRLSKLSTDTSFLDEVDTNTRSNRSSATIRPNPAAGTAPSTNGNGANTNAPNGQGQTYVEGVGFVPDFDFDTALVKFAAERENFLEDLSFTAGAKVQARPPMINPRALRIRAEDDGQNGSSGRQSPLKSIRGSIKGSIRGSIRRKISFKDMSSVRKQPTAPKPASIRTTKRLSNYNSVIPPPEPLNTDPNMHPLKRRFEPVLLDRYPPKDDMEEVSRRGKFPDYVPMFAFPNDIQIVSSDERPRSTWHGFTMTSDDNSKLYGITTIVWTALDPEVAERVERRCEEWRQRHMSNEERELAASLGIRLAAERAHLSQLLAKLPTVSSGSAERESLDDRISTVEEKIGLMTEMLRPLRHGAASKIDGLTAGDTGLWVPRAYGILGKDATKMSFWKEWLRAVVVPMTDGAILRVPPSSPKNGRWQPLERYVVNLCTEAFSPMSSKTQVELGVRELRLYARKEALNELPGSRTTDIYALFRCLSLENIVALFEYALSESRIIFLSSHTAMLHLAAHALARLLYPLKWASIFIPVLPARLISALEAPCPYIVGIERRYERIELPEDDYVLVDLDKDTIDATSQPHRLPKQHRRKILALLQIAAPHKIRYGVATGPPPYAVESFPYDAFSAEDESLFMPNTPKSSLGKWVTQNSSSFSDPEPAENGRMPMFNAFSQSKVDGGSWRGDRPPTGKSGRGSSPSSVSPISTSFPPMPTTPVSRSDSGFAVNPPLREKRSGHFGEEKSRRSSSFAMDKHGPLHRPSLPFLNGHGQSLSISGVSLDSRSSYGGGGGGYAPSTYAQSTLAASTVMPNMLVQPVRNTDTTVWVEGHRFEWDASETGSATCAICDDKSEGDGMYRCAGCSCLSHSRCLVSASLVCPDAFHAERVRAAFVRCLASLLYTYRKHLGRPTREQKSNGQLYAFDMESFIRSLPYEQQEYATMMKDTQIFNEFIHERESLPPSHPSIRLFDEIILAKKQRGRPGLSAGLSRLSTIRASHGASAGFPLNHKSSSAGGRVPSYLSDTSDHIWRTASVPVPSAKFPGDYRAVVTRIPARLDPGLMKEPRSIQGVPRPEQGGRKGVRGLVRKQVASMVGPLTPPASETLREGILGQEREG